MMFLFCMKWSLYLQINHMPFRGTTLQGIMQVKASRLFDTLPYSWLRKIATRHSLDTVIQKIRKGKPFCKKNNSVQAKSAAEEFGFKNRKISLYPTSNPGTQCSLPFLFLILIASVRRCHIIEKASAPGIEVGPCYVQFFHNINVERWLESW